MASKNDSDNRSYKDGYDTARRTSDPVSTVTDGLFRGFYGETWNMGYEQGKKDKETHGPKDD